MNRGLYTLIHVSEDSKIKSTFRMQDENGKIKDKFPLTTLDALTTRCQNMEELLLLTRELNIPQKNSKDEWLDGYFYIEYKNNHEIKQIDIVFNNNILIQKLSTENEGKYELPKDIGLRIFAYKIIKIRKTDHELYTYLIEKSYLSKHLSDLFGKYLAFHNEEYQNNEESQRILNIIVNHLREYKKIRDLIVGIYNYQMKQKINSMEIDNQTYRRSGQEITAEKQKVKRIMPPKGTQLKFDDIGLDLYR